MIFWSVNFDWRYLYSREISLLYHLNCLFISLLLALTPFSRAIAQSDLPELGDSATQHLNKKQEQQIGRDFFRQLLASNRFIADPEIQHYLNELGRQVGKNAALHGTTLHFNLLEENELNAFAVPGGYITFHSGLVLATDSESELASVMGHEIAHLSQRHLPRMLAKAEAAKLPTTAAIIASILIGGQVGVAGVTLANASVLSNQLAYSREFEKEADAIGMQLLAQSGFDTRSMAAFFNKLQRFNAITSKDVPEFLRSHPLSYSRIAEAESRQNSFDLTEHEDSFAFYLTQAKIRALYADRPEVAAQVLQSLVDDSEGIERDASVYGLSLAKMRVRDYAGAMVTLAPMAEKYPRIPAIQIALSEVERKSGATAVAVNRMAQLRSENPKLNYITHYYLAALLDDKNAAEAKKIARYQLRRNPNEFSLYRTLSKANVELGELAEAHQADGEYLAALGYYPSAIASMKLALRDNKSSGQYFSQSISARIKQLERLAEQAKKNKK